MGGCKVELYLGLGQREANEMLAVLDAEGIEAVKAQDKDGKVKILIGEADIGHAVAALKRQGYPREMFSTVSDVFPRDSLISSPLEEHARLTYVKSQELSRTLSEIDGVLVARVHVVLPEPRDALRAPARAASASIFIKHAADAPLDLYIGQMKQLLSNSIEGLDYERISVVLVPSTQARQLRPGARHATLLSIQVMEGSRLRLLALVGALLGMLLLSNLAQYLWWRQRA
ncbi:type III secretion system inner membrane ring lipoprotein SctJ [Pseudomonas sp. PONIH3]|jgi:type III secretion protein J|nr:type III secretion inner membrane ring lipoprotein SctJ [Pseudomonas sp. PONIH3]SER03165.1 type III secretion protein J [Pseudomonas soli]